MHWVIGIALHGLPCAAPRDMNLLECIILKCLSTYPMCSLLHPGPMICNVLTLHHTSQYPVAQQTITHHKHLTRWPSCFLPRGERLQLIASTAAAAAAAITFQWLFLLLSVSLLSLNTVTSSRALTLHRFCVPENPWFPYY